MLGVDGGSWNVIDPMLERGELPHLAALMERGFHADLDTVEPVTSPVVWTSIATGRSPEAHGVTDFFSTRLTVKTPSAFERLSAAGLRVGLYDFLMTWPPATLPGGFVIPGWLRRDDAVHPRDVWQRIPFEPYVNDYDAAKTSEDYLLASRRDVTDKMPRFLAFAKAFDLDVGATTIYSVDMSSHRFWHGAFPEEFEEKIPSVLEGEGTAVHDAVRGVDLALGELVAALGPDDTVIMLSDHGFEAREEGPRNVWVMNLEDELARAGLDESRDGFSLLGTFGAISIRVHPGDVAARDPVIDDLVALLESFQTLEGDALFTAVESIDVAERPATAQRPLLNRIWQWLVGLALQYVFGVTLDDTSQAVVFALPNDDALIALWPDGRVRIGDREVALREVMNRQVFTGAHNPTAIFVAAGAGIAPSVDRGHISVLDVAPLLFYLTGQALPDDLEGRLPREMIDAELLERTSPRSVPAAEAPTLLHAHEAAAVEDPDLVEKLRALGYVE
jgi:hypothetical protein